MIDLESVSQRQNAAIISIGAVKFGDGKLFDEFYCVISPQSCVDAGLHVEQKTLEWWATKPKEARVVLTDAIKNGLPLKEALQKLSDFLITKNIEVWAQGICYDIGRLEHAYDAVGLPYPWEFWNIYDARTIDRLCPRTEDDKKLALEGVYHNALDDAKTQAKRLMSLLDL
jgi:DNA polymerase III epsilon subunit-like protein